MTSSIKTRMALTARVRIRCRKSCSCGIFWSDDSTLTASDVDVVRFLGTGIGSLLGLMEECHHNILCLYYSLKSLSFEMSIGTQQTGWCLELCRQRRWEGGEVSDFLKQRGSRSHAVLASCISLDIVQEVCGN